MKPRINERCSSGLVNKIIGEVFDSELQALGFQKSTPRKYVRSRIQQTHDVIELLSQTIQLRFIWGISLQFVPHIEGRSTETVKWHRTVASANPDLRYSETENVPNGHVLYNVSTIHGETVLRDEAIRAKSVLLPRANAFFASVTRLAEIGDLFVREEQQPRWGSIFNTPQAALAFAFYLAKVGREVEARRYMSEWLKRSHQRTETNARLAELFEDALRTPLIVQ